MFESNSFSAAVDAKAAQSVAKIRCYYELGRRVNELVATNPLKSQDLVEEFGLNISTLRKARAFARQYEEADLNKLCALRTADGRSLHWGFVPVLLTMPHKTKRQRKIRSDLQKEAIKKCWTAPELYSQIRSRFAGRKRSQRSGGRPRKPIEPITELRQLSSLLVSIQDQLNRVQATDRAKSPWRKTLASKEALELLELLEQWKALRNLWTKFAK